MTSLVASTRMYNVAPGTTAAWHRLLGLIQQDSGVPLQIVDHPYPAKLDDLWARPDLGCAFMCGWPLAKEGGGRTILAAPVPIGGDGPRYHSVFVVSGKSPFVSLEQTFGYRFAFNARSSHSGWNMPMAHVARLGGSFSLEVGPFGPHQRAAGAVAANEADVAAIDSLVWALLCRYDPSLTSALRVVGRTPDQPSPPLVGTGSMADADADALRMAILRLSTSESGRLALQEVCLAGFTEVQLADYDLTLRPQ